MKHSDYNSWKWLLCTYCQHCTCVVLLVSALFSLQRIPKHRKYVLLSSLQRDFKDSPYGGKFCAHA